MKRLVRGLICAIGFFLFAGVPSASAELSLTTIGPSSGQTFQAQPYPSYPANTAFVRFEARISGPYLAGDVVAVINKDPNSLAQGNTSGRMAPMDCVRVAEPDVFAVCDREILGWIAPGTYYWRPYMGSAVFGTPDDFSFGGPYWGDMRSFTVLPVPPRPPAPSLRMTKNQAIGYAKRVTRMEVGSRSAYVRCFRRSNARFFCSTQAYRGRVIWSLRFLVWHRNDGGSVAATYRITSKKKFR